jgi:hypothetical protein
MAGGNTIALMDILMQEHELFRATDPNWPPRPADPDAENSFGDEASLSRIVPSGDARFAGEVSARSARAAMPSGGGRFGADGDGDATFTIAVRLSEADALRVVERARAGPSSRHQTPHRRPPRRSFLFGRGVRGSCTPPPATPRVASRARRDPASPNGVSSLRRIDARRRRPSPPTRAPAPT